MSGPLSSLKGEIKTDTESRTAYSRDASIFEVMPQGVIAPKNLSDLNILVTMANRLAIQGRPTSFTARNGGTDMSGGSLTEGWVLDMKHFNKIGEIDEYHKRVKVQGGVMHRDVEKAAKAKGLYFAPYTSSHDICGIGGMIGNNASGEKSLQHGPTSANVDRLKVVLSDGNEYEFGPLTRAGLTAKLKQPGFEGDLYRGVTRILEDNKHLISTGHPRTRKNAAGYALWELWNEDRTIFNMARLFIGSQGTLGIMTAAELKLVELPKFSRLIVTVIEETRELTPAVTIALKHKPAACETFDHYTYDYAKKCYPADAKRAKLAAGKHMVVLSVFEGDTKKEVDEASNAALVALAREGYDAYSIDDQKVIDSYLLIRRKSTALLIEHTKAGERGAAFLEDSVVPLEHYGNFLHEVEELLKQSGLTYTYAGHIGDGSIRLIPLVDFAQTDAAQQIFDLETRFNELVLKYHGSISADHNDGLIRTPYLARQYGPHMVRLFEQVKNLFDPFHIFNPGKKVFGSYEYALQHIIK